MKKTSFYPYIGILGYPDTVFTVFRGFSKPNRYFTDFLNTHRILLVSYFTIFRDFSILSKKLHAFLCQKNTKNHEKTCKKLNEFLRHFFDDIRSWTDTSKYFLYRRVEDVQNDPFPLNAHIKETRRPVFAPRDPQTAIFTPKTPFLAPKGHFYPKKGHFHGF